MRAFFAINVPAPVGEKLMALVPPIRGVRRGRADKLHITLHFLGDAPATLADDLQLPDLGASFTLTPGRLILLPESGPVRIVAASAATGGPELRTLHLEIGQELARLAIPIESRKYLPHITLARCDPPLPAQVRSQSPMVPREEVSFPVTEVHLIESRPAGRGFEYHDLKTWPLK